MLRSLHWIFFTAILVLGGCAGFNVELPAITDEPTNTRLVGKIVWHDLITDTPEASRRFYGELFGWEFEQLGGQGVNYSLIRNRGRLIGGLVDQTELQSEEDISQWMVLMSVADADAAVAHTRASGGTVFAPATDLADRGRMAILADPQGAVFAVLETPNSDPLDLDEPEVGGFLWNELWTSDIGAAVDITGP